MPVPSIDALQAAFAAERYVADRDLATAVYLSLALDRPLLLEGEAGVGKTEVGRADEEFEAYLLEVLADFAITIPEIGTIRAERPPHVIITSNRTREVHDALKRRCLYHWIDYPTAERELAILEARRPELPAALARAVVAFVQRLRTADLTKVPGIAETIDWAAALEALGAKRLEPEQVERTLGALLKYQEDVASLKGGGAAQLLDEVRAGG